MSIKLRVNANKNIVLENKVYFASQTFADDIDLIASLKTALGKRCLFVDDDCLSIKKRLKKNSYISKILSFSSGFLYDFVYISESTYEAIDVDFSIIANNELGCPIVVITEDKTTLGIVRLAADSLNEKPSKESFAQNKHLLILPKMHGLLKRNLYPIFSSLFVFASLFCAYGYGAMSYSTMKDASYQYLSRQIEDSSIPCGHGEYQGSSENPLSFTKASELDTYSVAYSNVLYTNFDILQESAVKKRTYVGTYIRVAPPSDSASSETVLSFGNYSENISALTLSDFGYASYTAKPGDLTYGRFYNLSLYRYSYVANDWIVNDPELFDSPLYISSAFAQKMIDQGSYSSFDEIIDKKPSVDLTIGDYSVRCYVANIITTTGQANYLTQYFSDFAFLVLYGTFQSKFSYSFCFDPSSSYLNVKGVAASSFEGNWKRGDRLSFYKFTGTNETQNGYQELSELGTKLADIYNSISGGSSVTKYSAYFLLAALTAFLIAFLIYCFAFFRRWIFGKRKSIHFQVLAIFIASALPIFLIQIPMYLFQLLSRLSIGSFLLFNYFGSNVCLYAFIGIFVIYMMIFAFAPPTDKATKNKVYDQTYEINI